MFFYKNKDLFDLATQRHYGTRTNDINYPIHRLTLSERSPYYMGSKLYNKLNNVEKVFKTKLKRLLLELEQYNVTDFLNM